MDEVNRVPKPDDGLPRTADEYVPAERRNPRDRYRWVHVVTVATVAVALLPVNMENTKSIWFILGFVAVSCPVWLTKDELSASVNLEVSRVQTRPRHIKAG